MAGRRGDLDGKSSIPNDRHGGLKSARAIREMADLRKSQACGAAKEVAKDFGWYASPVWR